MKNFKLAGIVIALIILFISASCSFSPPPTPPDNQDPLLTLQEAAQNALENLPELKIKLPASLSLDTATKSLSRAQGDTMELNAVNLPALKSQAWYNLQGTGGNPFLTLINKAFIVLKAYVSVHPVPVNEVFNIPVTDDNLIAVAGLPENLRGVFTTIAKFKITGDSSAAFKIYCDFSMSGAQGSNSMLCTSKSRFDITTEGAESKIDMYFKVGMEQSDGVNSFSMSAPLYANYDSKTGACNMAVTQEDDGSSYVGIQETKVDAADGSITNVNARINNGVMSHLFVAYGNAAAGGIASLSTWSYDGNGDGTPENHDNYWGEYYNGSGELLCRNNGDNSLWTPVYDEASYTNLKDLGYPEAPETYSVRYYNGNEGEQYYWYGERTTSTGWEAITREYGTYDAENQIYTRITQEKISDVWVDAYRYTWFETTRTFSNEYWNGSTWQPCGYNSNWNYMFKADSTPGVWTADDVVYYCKGSESYTESDINYWQTDFYKGYVVPAPVSKFGKNYYLSYEYPLKSVLPLAGTYAADYTLIQEEGETYTGSWTDWEGKIQTWSNTAYTYYLNRNSRDLDGDGITDAESPLRYDENFDIKLDKLSQYDMYYWNGGQMDKIKGYFIRTSNQETLPDYLSKPNTAIISAVDGKLQTLLNSAYLNSAAAYTAQIEVAKTATDGVF